MNRLVRRVLASPVHDVLGHRFAVVRVAGRRTGRTIEVPVNAMLSGDRGLLVLSRRDRRWWRNLRCGAPVSVLLDGRTASGDATVDPDPPVADTAALVERAYAEARHPVSRARAESLARDRVIVRIALDPWSPQPAPLRGAALVRRWTATVTLGETLAFTVPAVTGAALAAADAGAFVIVPTTLAASVAEGAVLGIAQALVLRRALPGIASRAWIAATVVGAAAAWAVGLVPILAGERLTDLPAAPRAALGVAVAGVVVSAIGVLQWRVLRGHVAGAAVWIPATALAWVLGLGAFMAVATPLWQEGQAPLAVAAVGLLAAGAMAVTVAAVSGVAVARLVGRSVARHPRASSQSSAAAGGSRSRFFMRSFHPARSRARRDAGRP